MLGHEFKRTEDLGMDVRETCTEDKRVSSRLGFAVNVWIFGNVYHCTKGCLYYRLNQTRSEFVACKLTRMEGK